MADRKIAAGCLPQGGITRSIAGTDGRVENLHP